MESFTEFFKPMEKSLESMREFYMSMASKSLPVAPSLDFYESFMKAYDDTVGKVMKMPTIGPSREVNAKLLKNMDAAYHYYAASMDFYFKLQKPMLDSMQEISEKAAAIFKEKPGDQTSFKEVYNVMISTYEKNYHELFKTEFFSKTLGNMMANYMEYKKVQGEMTEEFLKFTPVATKTDMDDVYKELYTLKKRVREQARTIQDLMDRIEKLENKGGGHRG